MSAAHVIDHPLGESAESETGHAAVNTQDEPVSAAPESQPEPAVEESVENAHTVLIVEDALELAEVIAETLGRLNIRTMHETHVDRALAIYDSVHPEVILLDIGLPDKNGWKLLDAIRQRPDHSPAVIVITAHSDPANRLMGKLQGVHSYLIKPFTPNEVERVVGQALAKDTAPVAEQSDDDGMFSLGEVSIADFIQQLVDGEDDARQDGEVTGGESEALAD